MLRRDRDPGAVREGLTRLDRPVSWCGCLRPPRPRRARSPTSSAAGPTSGSPGCSRSVRTSRPRRRRTAPSSRPGPAPAPRCCGPSTSSPASSSRWSTPRWRWAARRPPRRCGRRCTPRPSTSTRPSRGSATWPCCGARTTQLRVLSGLTDLVGTRLSRLGAPAATLLAGYGPARVNALVHDLGLTPTGDRHDDVAAVAARLADQVAVEKLLGEVDQRARAILEHLETEGKDGSVESTERSTSRGKDRGPVDQLLARGLLVARDRTHVAVPREVSLCLRGGRTTREPADVEPQLSTASRGQDLVDRAAGRCSLRAGPARRAAPRALGLRPAVGAARRRPLGPGPEGHRGAAARRRARRRAARRARDGGRPARRRHRPGGRLAVAADRRLRPVERVPGGREVGPARARVARVAAAGRAGRRPRGRQARERAGARPRARLAAGDPSGGADRARGPRARHRARRRHRGGVARRAAGMAAATAARGPRASGVLGGRRVRRRGCHRPRRPLLPRPRAADGGGPRPAGADGAGAAAARPRRPRAAPGRPDRGRPRSARAGARASPGHRRRRRVPRRRDGLPLHRRHRYVAPSTRAGPPPRCTTSWRRRPGRRCRRR